MPTFKIKKYVFSFPFFIIFFTLSKNPVNKLLIGEYFVFVLYQSRTISNNWTKD